MQENNQMAHYPRIVFTHGIGDTKDHWGHLIPFIKYPGAKRTWSLPGHSSSPAKNARAKNLSRNLAISELRAIVQETGDGALLVGHSFGGYLSLALAQSSPEIVRGIVLICSGPGFRDASARAAWNTYIDRVVQKNALPPAVADMAHQEDAFVIDNLAALRCPLLHIVGEHDRRYDGAANYLLDKVPGSELTVVPGARHHPQLDNAQLVADAIDAFVSRRL